VVLETLNILEGYELVDHPRTATRTLHLIAEALKASFADRHAYYGDPEFVKVPMEGLLSKEGEAGSRGHTTMRPSPGPEPPDTSYVCVADVEGNMFSATPSDGLLDTPLVPGLGIIMSARGNQSWLEADHPSSIAPGKRPRLTPSPGLVLKDEQVFMAYGTPGLDVQPQAMVQLMVNLCDYGMDVQEAIEAPRLATYSFPVSTLPHSYNPGLLCVEGRVSTDSRSGLERLGHRVEVWPDWTPKAGALCAVTFDPGERVLAGGADPRRLAYAIGW
jgi:gamma-glutamyltranspeptidase/glutathione hydrolase